MNNFEGCIEYVCDIVNITIIVIIWVNKTVHIKILYVHTRVRTTKRIIHEEKMQKKRMKETITTQNRKDIYVHKIIPVTSLQTSPNELQPR